MTWAEAAAQVSGEWIARGKLHTFPDDTSDDDDFAFWQEVKRRVEEFRAAAL